MHFDTAFPESTAPLEETMATCAKCQILVVDDDPNVRETVAMSLMAAGTMWSLQKTDSEPSRN